jgi:hypothetical protein
MYGMVNKILVLVMFEHRVEGCGIAPVRESWLRCPMCFWLLKKMFQRGSSINKQPPCPYGPAPRVVIRATRVSDFNDVIQHWIWKCVRASGSAK